jgi:hypothetical protein
MTLLTLLWGLGLAAEPCPEAETVVVQYADPVSAPAYRAAVRTALESLVHDSGCPVFATSGGVLDWVDVAGLSEKEQEIRKLYGVLEGVSNADSAARKEMSTKIRDRTSGYGEATGNYLQRFANARSHLTVSQARGEGWTNVYLELHRAQELLPHGSAFTFDAASPAERDSRVKAAILDLFPEYNRPPIARLRARQETEYGTISFDASIVDFSPRFQVGEPIVFDGASARDAETGFENLSFRWTVDGVPVETVGRVVLEHTFDEPGTRQVQLQVSDGALEHTVMMTIEAAERLPLTPLMEGVQVLGAWGGDTQYLTFAVEPSAVSEHSHRISYHWRQVEGPPLTCGDVGAAMPLAEFTSCREVDDLNVTTTRAALQVYTSRPGTYRFTAVEVVDNLPSRPMDLGTEALFTRSSVIERRFDITSGAGALFFDNLRQFEGSVHLGVPGFRIGASLGTLFIRPAGTNLHYTFGVGARLGFRDLTAQLLEVARNDPKPSGTYQVAWSPNIDVFVSAYVNHVFLSQGDVTLPNKYYLTMMSGPEVSLRNAFIGFGLAANYAKLRTDVEDWEVDLGGTIRIGFRANYNSSRTFYPPTQDRMDRFEAYRAVRSEERKKKRQEKKK